VQFIQINPVIWAAPVSGPGSRARHFCGVQCLGNSVQRGGTEYAKFCIHGVSQGVAMWKEGVVAGPFDIMRGAF